MISLEKGCRIALKEARKCWGNTVRIKSIIETEDLWIISTTIDKDVYGLIPVSINKETGELKGYPVQQHFEVFEKSKKIKIPYKYRKKNFTKE